jgi:ribosomal protein L7/L12
MNSARVLRVGQNDAAVAAEIGRMLQTGTSEEQVIAHLRQLGLDKIDSIKALRTAMGISLGKAKEKVHLSKAWADCREADDALHEAMFAAAKELGYVEVSGREDEAPPQ